MAGEDKIGLTTGGTGGTLAIAGPRYAAAGDQMKQGACLSGSPPPDGRDDNRDQRPDQGQPSQTNPVFHDSAAHRQPVPAILQHGGYHDRGTDDRGGGSGGGGGHG